MYVAVDIGGTTGRVAAFASTDDPAPVARQDFSMTREYTADLVELQKAIKAVAGDGPIEGVGLGIAGVVDPAGKTITSSGRLEGWHGHPIRADLEKAFSCPVKLANDSLVPALAEAIYGEIQESFWMVTWGTGVGGSLVEMVNGEPMVSPSELGHQIIKADDTFPADGCGRPGCLESLVAGDGIERRFGKVATDLSESEWSQVVEWFAEGLYNLMTIQFPPRIVMGGGLTTKCAEQVPKIRQALTERLKIVPVPELSVATHGEDAGLVGALALLRQS